jgi:CubicO group peptidase (beta-lactamase class C family)
MKLKALVVAISLLVCGASYSQNVNPVFVSGGVLAKKFRNHTLSPSSDYVKLNDSENLSRSQKYVAKLAEKVLTNNSALSILLVDRGQIIFEGYKSPATRNSSQFSFSMSKSLTAYTIGHLLCDGKINSLNDQASNYAPELNGTVHGEATIRQLLTMSSGAPTAVMAGLAYQTVESNDWSDTLNGKHSVVEIIQKFGKRDIQSGKEFRYLGNDTQALNAVAHNLGGLIQNFDKYIWKEARTESAGHWVLDRNGWPIAQAGFSATTRDWARLAIHSIQMQKSENKCIRNFMKEATTQQISNSSKRTGKAFNGYGYQTWTNPSFGDRSSYWWVGYGGQRIGIDPKRERIIVVSSYQENYMAEVYELFEKFQQM